MEYQGNLSFVLCLSKCQSVFQDVLIYINTGFSEISFELEIFTRLVTPMLVKQDIPLSKLQLTTMFEIRFKVNV